MKVQLQIGNYDKIREFFENTSKRKIMQKGRQVGGTIGAINNILQECVAMKQKRYLWIDTTYRMVKVYWHKYWLPALHPLPKKYWDLNKADSVIRIFGASIFFKSYDRADAIEGDNFDDIYINECGFLLKDRFLWEETLAPMLLAKNGDAVFIGTPKTGKNSFHFELINSIEQGKRPSWYLQKFTTYDNPYLSTDVIDTYKESVDPETVKTEVYGEFPDASLQNFFYQFRFEKHVCNLDHLTNDFVYVSFDFNVNPMTAIVFKVRPKGIEVINEFYLENSDIHGMCALIRSNYRHIAAITGDASGSSRSGNVKGLANYYETIIKELGLVNKQVIVPKSNPTHHNSRVLCNAILYKGEVRINARCKHLIEDLSRVQIKEATGEIDKSNLKLTHVSDCFRYAINSFCSDFIKFFVKE